MMAERRSAWGGWLQRAESWLAPSSGSCLACGAVKKSGRNRRNGESSELLQDALRTVEKLLCPKCAEAIPWITELKCRYCGRAEACPDCNRRKAGERIVNRSAVRYDPLMKDWLALYKYRGAEKLEPLFAAMGGYAYRLLQEELALEGRTTAGQTVISYIPLSDRRLGERGFNQAERTAARISTEHGLPLLPLLVRTRHTEKQSYKTRRERLESLEGAFAVAPGGLRKLRELAATHGTVNIILADDVYTTGSTLHRCGAELLSAWGAAERAKVYGITWFR